MRMHGFLTSAATVAALSFPGAASAINLVNNPDFMTPRAGLMPPVTDFTGSSTGLAGYAAADQWLVWTGVTGDRVRTRLEPSELIRGGKMLHVWGYEVDQVFAPPHTGSQHGYFCALVKVLAGSVGAGAGDQGNAGRGITVVPTDNWARIGGHEQSSPVNQVAIFGSDANAEYYIQSVELSPTPIPCERTVDRTKYPLPETYVKPYPYPWEMHPEQGSVVQPAGNPAQGNAANPNGFFNNMTPGTGPAQGSDHEGGHDHGGGKKQPLTGAAPPPAGNPIQQQQPAQPATPQ